jgi:hypothetical protein
MEDTQTNNETDTTKRPTFLTILCILTFISAGMGSLSALFTPPFSDIMVEFIKMNPGFDDAMKADLILVLQAGWTYYFLTFILSVCSLTGAILMWNMKKMGFHFYALSNLGLLFVPMLILSMPTNWGSILFTSCFIAMYGLHLKEMK